jgi:hypothetical protein
VFAWSVVVLAVCLRSLAAPRENTCYLIWANAARHWQVGADLYQPDRPGECGLGHYRYSPLVAILVTPFALLPDGAGGIAWRLVSAGLLLWSLAWWTRAVLPEILAGRRRALLFLLVLPFAVGNLNNAQANAIVLALLLAGTAAGAERRWNPAGALLALAALFKGYPIAVGLLLLATYPRPFAGRLAAALALGLILPFALQEPNYVASQYARWAEVVSQDDRTSFGVDGCYRDFALLCRVCGAPLCNSAYRDIEVLAGATLAGLCLAGQFAGWPRRRLLSFLFGVGTSWMTVFGPATESSTYILAGPALAWALLESWGNGRPVWLRAGLTLAYGLLLGGAVACWFPFGRSLQGLGPQPLGVLLLLLLLVLAEFPLRLGRAARPRSQSATQRAPLARPGRQTSPARRRTGPGRTPANCPGGRDRPGAG